jgi:hypothetical protein
VRAVFNINIFDLFHLPNFENRKTKFVTTI